VSRTLIGILVEYVETDDFEDGRPVPPGFPGDGIAWRLVATLPNHRSRWCGIQPANPANQSLVANGRGNEARGDA
jgi:hypothetical protein